MAQETSVGVSTSGKAPVLELGTSKAILTPDFCPAPSLSQRAELSSFLRATSGVAFAVRVGPSPRKGAALHN